MSEQRSYNWYRREIRRALSQLDGWQRRLFSAWCAEFLVRQFRSRILVDHSAKECEEIEGYAAEIWTSAAQGTALAIARATEINDRLLAVGPEDPERMIEVDTAAIEALSCLQNAVEAQIDPSVELVAGLSQYLINVLDYLELKGPGDPYSLENMFEFPPMAKELRIQLEFIDDLKSYRSHRIVPRSAGLGGRAM